MVSFARRSVDRTFGTIEVVLVIIMFLVYRIFDNLVDRLIGRMVDSLWTALRRSLHNLDYKLLEAIYASKAREPRYLYVKSIGWVREREAKAFPELLTITTPFGLRFVAFFGQRFLPYLPYNAYVPWRKA